MLATVLKTEKAELETKVSELEKQLQAKSTTLSSRNLKGETTSRSQKTRDSSYDATANLTMHLSPHQRCV